MIIRSTWDQPLLGRCKILFWNWKDPKLCEDNDHVLVPGFGCTLYRAPQCNLTTDNTADDVPWAFTTGYRPQQQAGENDIILIIHRNSWFKAGPHPSAQVLIMVSYYKVDIIFRSNDVEEAVFIFTSGKSIAMISVHASSFKIYSVLLVRCSDWFIVASRFAHFCEFSEFSQTSWSLVFLTYSLSARMFKEIWKVS